MLNVSYAPTRELYKDSNQGFISQRQKNTDEALIIKQSHGGSGKKSRSVIDRLEADVVTLALAFDIDAIVSHAKPLPTNWQKRLPQDMTTAPRYPVPMITPASLLPIRRHSKTALGRSWMECCPDRLGPAVALLTRLLETHPMPCSSRSLNDCSTVPG
ncbi:hypothetical protein [Crenobacter caeni]|uniref:hypothetical protein n=1 Tax=Crenobacter caeni TaxID=2705474 RepID=UPI00193FDEBA